MRHPAPRSSQEPGPQQSARDCQSRSQPLKERQWALRMVTHQVYRWERQVKALSLPLWVQLQEPSLVNRRTS